MHDGDDDTENTPQKQENPALKDLPQDKRDIIEQVENDPELLNALAKDPELKQTLSVVSRKSFSGPLPPPHILAEYNEIVPDAAERIFQLTEREAKFRHDINNASLQGDIKKDKRGQWMGFSIALAGFACATIMVLNGYEIAGSVIAAFDIVGLVAVFVIGRRGLQEDSSDNDDN